MSELIVHICGERVGRLIRKDNGNLQFRYDPGYAGPPASLSLPIQPEAHPHVACLAVFGRSRRTPSTASGSRSRARSRRSR